MVAFIEALDPAALTDADFDGLLAASGLVGGSADGGLALPDRLAEVNALLDLASPAMREALLDRVPRPAVPTAPMIEPRRASSSWSRRSTRGYERLRIMPYMAPSGLYWRLQVNARGTDDTAHWSTSGDDLPTADELLADHPGLAGHGRGEDPAYAAWVRRV